jgi:hypothetical protein
VFDIGGAVFLGAPEGYGYPGRPFRWTDLDAFTQGYVEQVLKTVWLSLDRATLDGMSLTGQCMAFSDLSPEALAAILRDCAEAQSKMGAAYGKHSSEGAAFWANRQTGWYASFPPLSAYLGDDGKVYLRPDADTSGASVTDPGMNTDQPSEP